MENQFSVRYFCLSPQLPDIRDHILLDERERYLAYGIPSKYLQQLQPSLLFYQRGYTDVLVM